VFWLRCYPPQIWRTEERNFLAVTCSQTYAGLNNRAVAAEPCFLTARIYDFVPLLGMQTMVVSGKSEPGVMRTVAAAGVLTLLSVLGWMALPASQSMNFSLCGAGLGGYQALPLLWLALTLRSPVQLIAPWLFMALAMSPPLVAPSLYRFSANIADASLFEIPAFLTGYAIVWVLATPIFLALELGIVVLAAGFGTSPLVVAATLALGWQATPWRRRALSLCGRSGAPTPMGRHSIGLEFGVITAVGCLGACWALMLASMSLAANARWPMVLVTVFLFVERVKALSARRMSSVML